MTVKLKKKNDRKKHPVKKQSKKPPVSQYDLTDTLRFLESKNLT